MTPTDAEREALDYEFDRYINGRLMAEGVVVERQPDLASAAASAAKIASRGPNGETPVLVLRAASPAPAQGVTITDEMVERAAIAWCSVAGVPFEMTMRSVTLESARAALAAALVGRDDGWQSVETAPHGEDVLLYCPEYGFASPAHVEVGPYSTGWRRDGYSTMSYHARATHWRPLPEPPLTPAPQEDTDRG